jgi:zinc transport system substrate-binding protein
MKTLKILLIILMMASLLGLLPACSRNSQTVPSQDTQRILKVYTTFYPLYDFTKKIVADVVQVENLIPAGVEPHDYELSLKQMAEIHDADIFIFLGESMEPWAKKIAGDLEDKGVLVIEAGKDLIENGDPHIWLDPVLAKQVAERIYEGIVSIDKDNEQTFKENLAYLNDRFDELDKDFKTLAEKAVRKDIVVSHAFLGYVANRYGFNQVAITGLSPQDEPSSWKMKELIEFCKDNHVKYIFDEQGGSSELSGTLVDETGAQILVMNPLGTLRPEEIEAGKDYFSIMKENLELLNTALVRMK